ncbi:MAG: hypothetical protein GQ474_05200 [Sulfurimonas sp.]|nr:hypothetical protein [Sulfurimonas sp.]
MKEFSLFIILISLAACSKSDLSSCIEDLDKARNSFSLESKNDGSDMYKAINTDQKYGSCFIKKLSIKESASIKEKIQAVLDYTSTTIKYVPDKKEALSDDIDRPGTRLPSRTVADGEGDCEDKAALAAVMLRELNIATFIIERPPIDEGLGHIFLGIKTNYNTGLKCGDDYFISFDPTIKEAKLGEKDAGLSIVKSFKCGEI